MRKSTQSNSKIVSIVALAVGVSLSAASPLAAGSGEVDVTPERAKICAKADKRYAKLYPDAPNDGAVIVKLYKYNFCPANVTVKPGTTVRWINVDKRTSHSVWLKEATVPESERFFPEETWQYTFENPGKYPYLCGPHWKDEGMLGFVKVEP
jgi:plastocyanin